MEIVRKSDVSLHVCEWVRERERERERGQTGRPTAMLRREILLIPAVSFTLSLNVSFGNSKLP
jgi:hypothetical protein